MDEVDSEIQALEVVYVAMKGLPADVVSRIVEYVTDRLESERKESREGAEQ